MCQKNKQLGTQYVELPARQVGMNLWNQVAMIYLWIIKIRNKEVKSSALIYINLVINLVEIVQINDKTGVHII